MCLTTCVVTMCPCIFGSFVIHAPDQQSPEWGRTGRKVGEHHARVHPGELRASVARCTDRVPGYRPRIVNVPLGTAECDRMMQCNKQTNKQVKGVSTRRSERRRARAHSGGCPLCATSTRRSQGQPNIARHHSRELGQRTSALRWHHNLVRRAGERQARSQVARHAHSSCVRARTLTSLIKRRRP